MPNLDGYWERPYKKNLNIANAQDMGHVPSTVPKLGFVYLGRPA